MALGTGQPIGHLCDLLGVSRFRPGVFDAMVDEVYGSADGFDETELDRKLDDLRRRMGGRP